MTFAYSSLSLCLYPSLPAQHSHMTWIYNKKKGIFHRESFVYTHVIIHMRHEPIDTF